MKRLKYVGSVNNVSIPGKGVIKRGDIVEFNEYEVGTLSSDNWQEANLPSFDNKKEGGKGSGHVGKRVVKRRIAGKQENQSKNNYTEK